MCSFPCVGEGPWSRRVPLLALVPLVVWLVPVSNELCWMSVNVCLRALLLNSDTWRHVFLLHGEQDLKARVRVSAPALDLRVSLSLPSTFSHLQGGPRGPQRVENLQRKPGSGMPPRNGHSLDGAAKRLANPLWVGESPQCVSAQGKRSTDGVGRRWFSELSALSQKSLRGRIPCWTSEEGTV